MNATTTIYTIKSIKTPAETRETMEDAIERAREIDAEYQPAFGVQVEDGDGETVWDSEKVEEAREWVRDHSDDDIDADELESAFVAIIGRKPDADDREQGLWSLLCAEVE